MRVIALALMLGAAGCGRVEPKAAPTTKVTAVPAVAPKPAGEQFVLPDYAARARAEVRREQAAELRARAAEIRVELPAKKK